MRIWFLTTDFPTPASPTKGPSNYSLGRALARAHQVRVIAPVPWTEALRGPPAGDLPDLTGLAADYPRFAYPAGFLRGHHEWFYWRSIRPTVWRLVEGELADLILSDWPHPDGAVAAHLGRLLGAPSALICGGSNVLVAARDPARRPGVLRALHAVDALLAVSQDLREEVLRLGIDPAKVHVWDRGVDRQSFAPGDRREARRRLGLPAGRPALLWVGRMAPVKGLDVLLEACARLRDRGVDYHLYLVGDGPLRPSLEAAAAAGGLAVSFVGAVGQDALAEWYRAADCVVLPSRSEGVPNGLRESLACGTPFVASRVGGIPEIAGGAANRLVPPGDAEALAEALAAALAGGPRPADPLPGWDEAARSLADLLGPLVARSQNPDRPWWAGRSAGAGLPVARPGGRRGWRALRRAALAVLPRRLLVAHGPAASGAVCLTFDDGPHPEHTPRLLDVLGRYGVRATFFVVGRAAGRHPGVVRRIAGEGHLVANHSFLHARAGLLSPGEGAAEARRGQRALLRAVGGVAPLYRPPGGELTLRGLVRLWLTGQAVALWNVDPRDYALASAGELRAWFRARPLRAGDVVLLHDRLPHAAEALPEVIEATRAAGLRFATLDEWAGPRPAGSRPG